MKTGIVFFAMCFSLFSCSLQDQKPIDKREAKQQLMEADKAFSALCEKEGMKSAFIEYLDSNGVLLRPGHMPIVGAAAIDFIIQQSDTGYTLSWQPSFADVSASGDMGYTYGLYTMTWHGIDSVSYGTYTSIWKKQSDGKWKYVLDSGNDGVEIE